jgi:plasmid maintenance system antidote protein VapI
MDMGRPKKAPVRPENYSKTYSDEEIAIIDELVGTHTLNSIAKKLGRPLEGLRVKVIELGYGDLHMEAGTYSAKALAEAIGVSHEAVRRWVLTKGLPAKKKSRYTGVDRKDMHYHITIDDFWKWAEKNKDFIEFNKIPLDSLPPEPAWVMYERRKQFYRPAKQKIWTPEEDETLLDYYYKQALKQREIADKMGRTQNSIEKRLKRLREMQKL